MSDTAVAPESVPPIPPSPESTPEPAQEAAPAVAPAEPPPASDDQAGADAPPADAPPGDVPAAAAPVPPIPAELSQGDPEPAVTSEPPPVIESTPVPEGTKTSEPITTPVEARLALGDDSGLPPDVVDEHPVAPEPEHPHTTLQRIREKLAAYGEECLETVRHEIEYLQNLFHTHLPPPGGDVS